VVANSRTDRAKLDGAIVVGFPLRGKWRAATIRSID